MNLTTLRAAQPATLFTAAERLRDLAARIDAAAGELSQLRGRLQAAWRGQAAEAALSHLDRLRERYEDAVARMTEVGKAVWRFADALSSTQDTVHLVDRAAAQNQLGVGDDGVELSGEHIFDGEWVEFVQSLNRSIAAALAVAAAADAECAAVFGLPPAEPGGDGDGGSIWGDIWNGLGWASNASTLLGALGAELPGASIPSAMPFGGAITLVSGGQTIGTELDNMLDGEREGFGVVAQGGKAVFAAAGMGMVLSSSAIFPPLALGAVAVWGVSNLLDTHWGTISEGWHAATDAAGDAVSWGFEQGGNLVEGAGDAVGAVGDFIGL